MPFFADGEYSTEDFCWEQCGQFVMKIVDNRLPRSIRRHLGVSDVVQSVLCLVQAKRSQFRGNTQAEFRSWVMRIAERKVVDSIRRHRRSMVSLDDHEGKAYPLPTSGATNGIAPSEQIEAQEQVHQMLAELGGLPEQLRQIVELRYLKNMTFEQIAAELEISTTTCRRRWMHAITRISTQLNSDRP
ncbi:ECF RNA polymerase sigma-E factor [Rubripirellula amarantea]|uniref:ECF RNA polymerase sigma-E factor n=2 Tax=Rubripirellula amarantea TaxID=2527999 RepID=A0A5C5WUT1_9BACT|nr:ECF RNA polymerase sigma-E factor [Rubripirellula amarantea]